ncbi:hypothetical protein Sjap_006458 [Stephania japonica]|uniref:Uncharacterized protein n=1 Tax=Stephania japonica TaxID=461633 RepID=A0AAP0K718_9MAGN
MATTAQISASLLARANLRRGRNPLLSHPPHKLKPFAFAIPDRNNAVGGSEIRVSTSGGGDSSSYLEMWKRTMDQERKQFEFEKILESSNEAEEVVDSEAATERKSEEFMKILEVPKEERDRVQRMQVIDRAAAAIAAAQSLLSESPPKKVGAEGSGELESESGGGDDAAGFKRGGLQDGDSTLWLSKTSERTTPGPDFWSWTPPLDDNTSTEDFNGLKMARQPTSSPTPMNLLMDKERIIEFLPIPFESGLLGSRNPPLPPFQSLVEAESKVESSTVADSHETGVLSSVNAAEAVEALSKVDEALSEGVNPDGSKWWKETGVERRPDGVLCRWTLTRGVSADKSVEWEEKYWEAADKFDYKELGSEKSGRDAAGNVWRESWRESMWQDLGTGLLNMEKTADKWGKNGSGTEWQEKWWEHYDASGHADKWAHKWCSIDPHTPLEPGHAHVWHERWGEKYDGQGASIKYTDKWAERLEGDGWTKWGDKWDENFDHYSNGVKQGETWWQGKYGEQWNRTWGEHHNGSGWVHKYGKSSSGEHWDTHVHQDTWYERFPHFGFDHCFENSGQLRQVRKPSET